MNKSSAHPRVLITTLEFPAYPLCVLNCYLPSGNSKEATEKFMEDIDTIDSLINRYKATHEVIIMGDLNEDHFQRKGKKENAVRQLIQNHKLNDRGKSIGSQPTYYNPHLEHRSHIDHILTYTTHPLLQWSEATLRHWDDELSTLNTSYHHPLFIQVKIPTMSRKMAKRRLTMPRRKIYERQATDRDSYQHAIEKELENFNPHLLDPNDAVKALQSIINTAMHESTPYRISSGRPPPKPNIKWTPELAAAVKKSKEIHFSWKKAGRPTGDDRLWVAKKEASKQIRRVQRKQNAEARNELLREIDQAAENDSKLFHKLLQRRRTQELGQTAIWVNGELSTNQEIIRQDWANYYEELSTPKQDHTAFDRVRALLKQKANMDRRDIQISSASLNKAIQQLATGKAADIHGFYAEQIRMLPEIGKEVLRVIINNILQMRQVPESLKEAYKLPIPKKGKDPKVKDNYRGITIASIFLKVLETVCLQEEIGEIADSNLNELQFGFTKNRSPSMASLLISESIAEARSSKSQLFAASLDAKKAFDVVSQPILMNKLSALQLSGAMWETVNHIYTDSTEVVRWAGQDSRNYQVRQGVKQGSILSPTLYKFYINDLLNILEYNDLGNSIGCTFTGSPTCADDVLLLSCDKAQLQAMLDIAQQYSTNHSYQIHPQKTVITELVSCRRPTQEDLIWTLGDAQISTNKSFTHLGLEWVQGKRTPDFAALIRSARKAAYSLMRVGLHGEDGLGPSAAIKIVQTFVTPRLLYGIEATIPSKQELEDMEKFHRKILRQIQGLPESTATEAIYILSGDLPIQLQYHMRVLTLFGSICRLSMDHPLRRMAKRQMATQAQTSKSWFSRAKQIGELYELNLDSQLCSPWPKRTWKKFIQERIRIYHHYETSRAAQKKSSLKWVKVREGKGSHPIWKTCRANKRMLSGANIRARLLVGRYPTQALRAKFEKQSPTCQQCHQGEEDTLHMVAKCEKTRHLREELLIELGNLLGTEETNRLRSPVELCTIILNGPEGIPSTEKNSRINNLFNKLCIKLDEARK